MKKNSGKNLLFGLVLVLTVFLAFKNWFVFRELSAGDAGFFYAESLRDFPLIPYTWINDGLGRFTNLLYSFYYLILPQKILSIFGFPWLLIEKLVWYWPFLILSIYSSRYFFKIICPKNKLGFLASCIYIFNTYILMIIGGGQVSIALAYAIAPLVLALFIKNCRDKSHPFLVLAGLLFALQISFEPRTAMITLAVFLFYLFCQYGLATFNYLGRLLIYLLIAIGVHFYWLLPALLLRKAGFSSGLTSPGWVKFLSFANFSNTLALLHPNWPENIFGKTYFFRPEFLILPILAFISLLFINRLKSSRVKKTVLFFSALALIGAFLAKGVNPPFGFVYSWLFNHLPGMNLFRDASKFYLLVALSYSILIPSSIENIYLRLKPKLRYLFLLFIISCLLFLIRPAISGQLGGTFKSKSVPPEYLQLKDFLARQPEFFRTFWVPTRQRFGFYSNSHPAINAESFVTDSVCQEPFCSLKTKTPEEWGKDCPVNDRCYVRELSYLLNPEVPEILSRMAVKYVIVPGDPEGEIFIENRRYNPQQRWEVEQFLATIPWLKKIEITEKIAVYELPEYKDHFFIDQLTGSRVNELTSWKMINPTKYLVSLKTNQPPATLVFSEAYDHLWQAKIGNKIIGTKQYRKIFNSFLIDQKGDLEITIELTAQKYVYWGMVISAITFLLAGGILIFRLLAIGRR